MKLGPRKPIRRMYLVLYRVALAVGVLEAVFVWPVELILEVAAPEEPEPDPCSTLVAELFPAATATVGVSSR